MRKKAVRLNVRGYLEMGDLFDLKNYIQSHIYQTKTRCKKDFEGYENLDIRPIKIKIQIPKRK